MNVKADKEEGGSVGMHASNKSAVGDVSADMDYRGVCGGNVRGVVYG